MSAIQFASPGFLIGILSLGIPFLLLISRSDPRRVIPFSSLQFLSLMTKNASTRIEWKKIFLLVIRLLLLLLLALGFALPFFKNGGAWFGPSGRRHRVFVLDNSYSMGYAEKGEEAIFEKAKNKIKETVQNQPQAFYSLFVVNSKLENIVSKTSDKNLFLKALEEVRISESKSDFTQLFPELSKNFTNKKSDEPEILIFSDFSIPDPQTRNAFELASEEAQKQMKLEMIPTQPQRYKNFSIRDLVVPPWPLLPKREEEIRIFYDAYGYIAGEEVEITVSSGEMLNQKFKVQIPNALKGSLSFRVAFPSAGHFALRVESGPDGLIVDNFRYAVVYVRKPVDVLFVEDSDYDYPFERPDFYFTRAFDSSRGLDQPAWVNIVSAGAQDLGGLPIANYDFVVLADTSGLTQTQFNQLGSYLEQGGRVLFSFGKNFEKNWLEGNSSNQAFWQFLKVKAGEGAQGAKKQLGVRTTLDPKDYQEPLLKIFDGGRQGDLRKINFSKFVPLMPEPGEEKSEILLWFESKWPALIKRKVGRGTLFIWTSSLNHEWTDFPKSPLYVPFMLEFLKTALLQSWKNPQGIKVDEALSFEDIPGAEESPIFIKDPKGESFTLYTEPHQSEAPSLTALYGGFYEWAISAQGAQERNLAACNVDSQESTPGYIRWNAAGLNSEKQITNLVSGAETGTLRRFTYRPLLDMVFVLLLVEAWVANQMYKPKRIGSPTGKPGVPSKPAFALWATARSVLRSTRKGDISPKQKTPSHSSPGKPGVFCVGG